MAARRDLRSRPEEAGRPVAVDRRTAQRNLADARRRLRANAEDIDALNDAGLALLDLGRLDEAHLAVQKAVEVEPHNREALRIQREVLDRYLWRMVDAGDANWRGGGKPRGMKHPIKLTPGPSITELVHEGRR